ncbi:hypothetical protein PWJ90_36625 [Nocardia gipuzkoensis]|nr:hypothetical protein [Nocardia gipuzkoensis]MDE1675132.1 hypothetical protein [Nocardia gipuzkoensis]
MFSGPRGTGFAEGWLPRIVAERFTASTRDGDVARAPDPVPFIDAELSWTNTSEVPQQCWVNTHRAPRTIVAANPNTYALDDALSWDVGMSPNAPTPFASENGIGARLLTTPFAVNEVGYTRLFRGWDDSVRFDQVGTVAPEETVHLRYRALFTTPGQWRAPNQALQVVRAYWVRLQLWAVPEATP